MNYLSTIILKYSDQNKLSARLTQIEQIKNSSKGVWFIKSEMKSIEEDILVIQPNRSTDLGKTLHANLLKEYKALQVRLGEIEQENIEKNIVLPEHDAHAWLTEKRDKNNHNNDNNDKSNHPVGVSVNDNNNSGGSSGPNNNNNGGGGSNNNNGGGNTNFFFDSDRKSVV